MAVLLESRLPGLEPVRRGKVRELYDLGDCLLMVATDRVSAFDVVMENGIPGKGAILNRLSAFWFERLAPISPHHLITIDDLAIAERIGEPAPELVGRAALVRRATPLPIECVARGYLAGSLYKEYQAQGPGVHELDLPAGLLDGDRLPEPIFTPATKAETGHDENLSFADAADLVGYELAANLRDLTLTLYREAERHARTVGLILADTKFEFGLSDDGLIWIDEALTPDSSRYWEASDYRPGGPQPSFDKQPLRDWLEASGWNKRPPGPRLPDEVVASTQARYEECYRRLTGREP
jgi:phosphoribosylaminoimidazole-succinocarboxamide synthase